MDETELLTQSEAALFLGLKPNTLAVWRCTNRVKLPYVKLGSKVIRYRRADLIDFISSGTVNTNTPSRGEKDD